MLYFLIFATVLVSYLFGGVNSAIILSKLLYHKDIREYGSGNPGFTNFKRVFGGSASWFVLLFDILKTVIPVCLFSILFSNQFNMWQLGASLSGLSCMLGHAFPIWYKFRGGKTFVTSMTAIWFIDWRVGLIGLCVFALILSTTKFMSLASISYAISCPIALAIIGPKSVYSEILLILAAVLLVWRHKANIGRLINHEESKFSLKKRKA